MSDPGLCETLTLCIQKAIITDNNNKNKTYKQTMVTYFSKVV